MPVKQNNNGFSLIEVIVASGVFLLFALGIYGGIQAVFQIVYQSRLRIIETAVLNEQIEIIRNMSFFDVGIVQGSPAGLLERTVTTTRNGIDFEITRTIRNIDDPFDGTIDAEPVTPPDGKGYVCHGGSTLLVAVPAVYNAHLDHGDTEGPCSGDPEAGSFDQSPADYKFVEVGIICVDCGQRQPLTLSTIVAPKYLEGDPNNGALFLYVIDANGNPVSGANISILSTSTNPTYNFTDQTDNEGAIRIVDLTPGQDAYHILVDKVGYTVDGTTTTVANPFKPPVSVVAQSVTSRTFTIDQVSELNIRTIDAMCASVGSASLTLSGERLLGTDPDTQLVNQSFVTAGDGTYTYTELPWDAYSLVAAGYDVIGAIPMLPLSVAPGATVDVSLLLGTNTDHSILVHVQDSATADPISSSTVRVYGAGYDTTKTTGVGTIRQTDWSGGANQDMYEDETRYWTDDGHVDVSTSAGNIMLGSVGSSYVFSGNLESSIFDFGLPVNPVQISWTPGSQPVETGAQSVRIQIATSNSSTSAMWEYLGPDGTNSTYYTSGEQNIAELHNGDQYLRYKLYLNTASSTYTPTVSDVTVSYVTSCTPPGQAYFGSLSQSTYTIDVVADGYVTYNNTIEVDGDMRSIVELTRE
jgi:prepilin-type N-terminal cleavage/methylation domain-containing protein